MRFLTTNSIKLNVNILAYISHYIIISNVVAIFMAFYIDMEVM